MTLDSSHTQMAIMLWSIADDVLRDVFMRRRNRDIILPIGESYRFKALLKPAKEAVKDEFTQTKDKFTDTVAQMESVRQNDYVSGDDFSNLLENGYMNMHSGATLQMRRLCLMLYNIWKRVAYTFSS